MPIKVKYRGIEWDSREIDDDLWEKMKQTSQTGGDGLNLLCCGARAIPKLSPRKNRFFAHHARPKACAWKPESDLHIVLKYVVLEAMGKYGNGWSAEPEVDEGKGWRADVLARKGDIAIAFEIQISGQTARTTTDRDKKYLSTGVLPFWFQMRTNQKDTIKARFASFITNRMSEHDLYEHVYRQSISFLETIDKHIKKISEVQDAISQRIAGGNDNILSYDEMRTGGIIFGFRLNTPRGQQDILVAQAGPGLFPEDYETNSKRDVCNVPVGYADSLTGAWFQRIDKKNHYIGPDWLPEFCYNVPSDKVVEVAATGSWAWLPPKTISRKPAAFIGWDDTCSDILSTP